MSQSRHAIARLLAAVVNSQQREGGRVARLLHDDVGQILSAAGLHLDVLRMDVEADRPEVAERIVAVQKILEEAVDRVRSLSYEMNPEVVERVGLRAAMDRLIGRYRDMTQISVRLVFDSSVRITGAPAASLYRIAESALDNAVKHSGCRRVEIFVRTAEHCVSLEVRDDGRGFDVEKSLAEPTGLGLLLMNCYAEHGQCELEVKSTGGEGTIVKATSAEHRQGEQF